jgi:hypothetical protein
MTENSGTTDLNLGQLQLERQVIDLRETLEESPIFREKIKQEEEVFQFIFSN